MLSSENSFHINFSISRDADRGITIAHNKMLVFNFFECEATRYIKYFIVDIPADSYDIDGFLSSLSRKGIKNTKCFFPISVHIPKLPPFMRP